MFFPVKITCTVQGRKNAHNEGWRPLKSKASFLANQEADSPEEAVKLLAQVFTAEDGYRVEPCPAS